MTDIETFQSGYPLLHHFEKEAAYPLSIIVQRGNALSFTYHTKISEDREKNYFYLKKIILSLLWIVGGNRILFNGKEEYIEDFIKKIKEDSEFDTTKKEMERMFHLPFLLEKTDKEYKDIFSSFQVSGSQDGSRIGLDLGGSDRKVTAIKDGQILFQEEDLWSPKEENDIQYHYQGILDSLKKAVSHLGKVDSIGISTSGILEKNRYLQATLFKSVVQKDRIPNFFIDFMKKEYPDIPYTILNDGDVSALYGSLLYKKGSFLGIAMGTSLGGGYIQEGNSFNGWICEIGKIPIDYSPSAFSHYSMKIKGAGSEYLSQKGIIRILESRGFPLSGSLPEKLVTIQNEAEQGNETVLDAYRTFGKRLGTALCLYHRFIPFENVVLLGRVTTGIGGEILMKNATDVLKKKKIEATIYLPDENQRRLGQSYIASQL